MDLDTLETAPALPGSHESKFVLDVGSLPAARAWLSSHCAPDPDHPHNRVCSVYYDTPDLALLDEKRNSDFGKSKIRVRWYASPGGGEHGGTAHMERKYKRGARRFKSRVPVDHPVSELAAAPLEGATLRRLPGRLATGDAPPGGVVPVVRIEYERRRFVDRTTGARVCIDSRISAPRFNRALFNPAGPARLTLGVVEIKHPRRSLPPWVAWIPRMGGRRAAFSKYLACCDMLASRSYR